jgi:hypothetical protein
LAYVNEEGVKARKDFDQWSALALDINKRSNASRKKNRVGSTLKGSIIGPNWTRERFLPSLAA